MKIRFLNITIPSIALSQGFIQAFWLGGATGAIYSYRLNSFVNTEHVYLVYIFLGGKICCLREKIYYPEVKVYLSNDTTKLTLLISL